MHFFSFTCQLTTCAAQLSVNDSRQSKQSAAVSMRTVDSRALPNSTNCFSPRRTVRFAYTTFIRFVVAEWTWGQMQNRFSFRPPKLKSNLQINEELRRKSTESHRQQRTIAANANIWPRAKSSFVINGRRNCAKMEKEIGIGHTTHTHTHHYGDHFPTCAAVAAHSFDDDFVFLLLYCFVVAIELQSFFFCWVSEIGVKVPAIVSGRYLLFVYNRCRHLYFHWLRMNLLVACLAESKCERVCIEEKNSKRFLLLLFLMAQHHHSIDSKVTIFL